MAKVERGIHAHFASIQQNESVPAAPAAQEPSLDIAEETLPSQNESSEVPFAKVNSVVEGSPAARAGMKVGDKIRSFGSVNWMNHENLSKVADLVQCSEGVRYLSIYLLTYRCSGLSGVSTNHEQSPILIKVDRQNASGQEPTNLSLLLTPCRNWGGRGLLGCHLLPL
jgi:26S proteasome regulatory subunit N4